MKKTLKGLDDTKAFSLSLAKKIKNVPTCIAFFGDLGAGKTTMTRFFCEWFGIFDEVTSPTFALLNEYHGTRDIYHFDMYRIESFDDLLMSGFFDYYDHGDIVICEWSENIENVLPENVIKIFLKYGENDDERKVEIKGEGEYVDIGI